MRACPLGSPPKTAWLDEMVSQGVVRQRFLPPHAGGPPATRHVGSPIESILHPGAAGEVLSGGSQQPPAPAHQRVQETGTSRKWLQGPLRDCARKPGDDGGLARSLLDAGASTDAVDRAGRSPLHWACTRGNTAVVVALLDAGADGSARDGSGKTPLHCAAQVGHTAIVVVLLDHYGFMPLGLQAEAVPGMAVAMQRRTGDRSASVLDARNAYGSTALHRAAFNGRDGVVMALMRGGASVNVVGKSGRSALHLACQNAHAGCVQILLAWGAQETATAKDGSTPWSELAQATESRPPGCPRVAETAFYLNTARGARAWGRRGWLLMLKYKNSREMTEAGQGSDVILGSRGVDEMAVFERDAEDFQGHGRVRAGETENLARLVGQLLEIGEEGCFRLVVGFL